MTTIRRPDWPLALVAMAPVLFALATWPLDFAGSAIHVWTRSLPLLAIELVVVSVAVIQKNRHFPILETRHSLWRLCLYALILVAFASALRAIHYPSDAVIRTELYVVHLAFGLATCSLLAKMPEAALDRLAWWLVGGVVGYLLLLFPYVVQKESVPGFDWGWFGLAVHNIRQVGFFLAPAIVISLALSLNDGRITRTAMIVVTILMFAVTFWSGTRGVIFAVGSALLAAPIVLPFGTSFRLWVTAAASALIGVPLSLLHVVDHPAFGFIKRVSNTPGDSLTSGRAELWANSIELIPQRPFLGYGESEFRYAAEAALGIYGHPHNAPLQFAVQWGIPAAILLLVMTAVLTWKATEATRRLRTLAPFWLALVALLAYSLIDGAFYHPYPIMMFALCMAVMLTRREGHAS